MSGQKLGHNSNLRKKPCVCSRGHIFSPIIMKLGQNVVLLIKSWSCLKMGHFGSKMRSNLLKNLVYTLEATFSVQLS